MSADLQIWPHAIAAIRRARDATGPHDSARFVLSQLAAAFDNAGAMLAIGRVDAAIDLLADVEPATCDACRMVAGPDAQTTVLDLSKAIAICSICLREHDPRDCCQA